MPGDSAYARLSMALPDRWLRRVGKLNVPVYRLTRGRVMGRVSNIPVLLLTTTGLKSGQQRTAPVVFGRDGDNLVVIGSNAGNARTPAWALNLQANPGAEVQIRGERRTVSARVAVGEERERLWDQIVAEYSGFADYAVKTDRDIKVFVLEPV